MSKNKYAKWYLAGLVIVTILFDIWLDNPVTKTYLQCLEWSGEQIAEILGNGGFVDSTNNDRTSNQIHSALGEKEGLIKAGNPNGLLITHEMLEIPEEEESE